MVAKIANLLLVLTSRYEFTHLAYVKSLLPPKEADWQLHWLYKIQERKQDQAILLSNDRLHYLTEAPFPDTIDISSNMSRFDIISWGLYWAQIQQKYKCKFIHKGSNKAKLAAMVFTVPAVILQIYLKPGIQ